MLKIYSHITTSIGFCTYINDFTFTSERAGRDFGFVPKYTHDEGFERTVAWFRENGPVRPDGSPLPIRKGGRSAPCGKAENRSGRTVA